MQVFEAYERLEECYYSCSTTPGLTTKHDSLKSLAIKLLLVKTEAAIGTPMLSDHNGNGTNVARASIRSQPSVVAAIISTSESTDRIAAEQGRGPPSVGCATPEPSAQGVVDGPPLSSGEFDVQESSISTDRLEPAFDCFRRRHLDSIIESKQKDGDGSHGNLNLRARVFKKKRTGVLGIAAFLQRQVGQLNDDDVE